MIESIEEFWNEFTSFSYSKYLFGSECLFRGVSDKDFQLIPSIGRNTKEGTNGDIDYAERTLIQEFKRLSAPVLDSINTPKSDFEWLFLAQHYGVPTRLLDWSTNPLVALYFAVEKDDEVDGAIYYLKYSATDQYDLFDFKTANYTEEHKKAPASDFAIQANQGNVIFVRPKYTDQRYLNQRSVFSSQKDPYTPIEVDDINIMHFKGEWKADLRARLKAMGVSSSFIYPGLDGIGKEVKAFVYDPITKKKLNMASFTCRVDL